MNRKHQASISRKAHHLPQPLLSSLIFFVPGVALGWLLGRFTDKLFHHRPARQNAVAVNSRRKASAAAAAVNRPVPSGLAKEEHLKMVLVVRQDLKMGAGKVAAQCAHAAVGVLSELRSLSGNASLLHRYESAGQPKIVVVCRNLKELLELQGKARGKGLPTYVVCDAGRTQVAAGSKTVLAVGPGAQTTVDEVTRHLKLM